MVQSCFPTLAASPPAAAWKDFDFATWPTSPLAIHVRGFNRNSSGRSSRRGHIGSITTHSLRHCRYKTVAGRSAWLNRDPIAEKGGVNVYEFVKNNSENRIDAFGLLCCSANGGSPTGPMGIFGGPTQQQLIDAAEAAWEAAQYAVPGSEFTAVLNVFGSCNSLGLANAYINRKLTECDCMEDEDAKKCHKKWDKKKNIIQNTYNKLCP